jgi:hypothetical protein
MMVKIFPNINKANNHFHLISLNTKKATTYDVGNPDPVFGQAQKCGAVKPVNGIRVPTLSNGNTYISKR